MFSSRLRTLRDLKDPMVDGICLTGDTSTGEHISCDVLPDMQGF